MNKELNGILLINKPKGLTSHDVVYEIKRKFNLKKVGHTGTLDPFATGLLILLINKATKLAYLFDDLDKSYSGEIIFNKEYDTNDTTGTILAEKDKLVTLEMIKSKVKEFMPSYLQAPPIYSAIKKGGVKSYEAARLGIDLNLNKREVLIYNFDIIKFDKTLQFQTKVSKGTYIRSIARDLGYKLNTYGSLDKLNRLMIGDYHLKNAKTIEDISLTDLINDKELFDNIPKIAFNDYLVRLIKNGVYLDDRNTNIKTNFIATNQDDEYIAYYEYNNKEYVPKYFFD